MKSYRAGRDYPTAGPVAVFPMSPAWTLGHHDMEHEPTMRFEIVERPEQPYVYRQATITMTTYGALADQLPEMFGLLAARGVAPAGGPIFRYRLIDMPDRLDVEAGIPLTTPADVDPSLAAGSLPAGRYVHARNHGHPDQLLHVIERMLQWAGKEGLTWDRESTPEGERWACRYEQYLTDPTVEPDPSRWDTDVFLKLAD
jgi:hypothetical protein